MIAFQLKLDYLVNHSKLIINLPFLFLRQNQLQVKDFQFLHFRGYFLQSTLKDLLRGPHPIILVISPVSSWNDPQIFLILWHCRTINFYKLPFPSCLSFHLMLSYAASFRRMHRYNKLHLLHLPHHLIKWRISINI